MRQHSSTLIRLLRSLDTGRTLYAAEVGVFEGYNARALLQHVPNLNLTLCDHWKGVSPDHPCTQLLDRMRKRDQADHDRAYREMLRHTDFAADRRIIIRKDSVAGAEFVLDGCLDLGFIDAEHTEEAARDDMEAWLPKVRPGGIFCGHDYGGRRYPGVAKASHAIADRLGVPLEVLPGRMFAIRLPACVLA